MESIGEILRKRREERDLTLAVAHEATKITLQNLAALEEDRFDAFPNRVYARAFLRDYANFLGLDSGALLERYEEASGAPVVQPTRRDRVPRAISVSVWQAAAFVLIVAAAGGYYYVMEMEKTPRPAAVREVEPEQKPVPPPAPRPAKQPVTEADAAAPKPEGPPAEKPVAVPEPRKVQVTLRAVRHNVWLHVIADGKTAFMDTLRPGDQATFVAEKRIWLRAGNAGYLDVTVNGKHRGRLGKPGVPQNALFEAAERGDV